MKTFARSLNLTLVLMLGLVSSAMGHPRPASKTYPLSTWSNMTCRNKGRFQDRQYCESAVMDEIVADGKSAIPILISQITDSRMIAEPVYDFWPQIRTGELAYLILSDLFLDDTWQKRTMPDLFPAQKCKDQPSWVCWEEFRKTHSLKDLQARWTKFWEANQGRIYWDDKARCFRLTETKAERRADSPRTGDLYTQALFASLAEANKKWGKFGQADKDQAETRYFNMPVAKFADITDKMPQQFEMFHVEYLDYKGLQERYERLKKSYCVAEISPMTNEGPRLAVLISFNWISVHKHKFSRSVSDWSEVYFRYDCARQAFVVDQIELGGI